MGTTIGVIFGFLLWFAVRYGVGGFYTVGPSERAVMTSFGRAQRLGERTRCKTQSHKRYVRTNASVTYTRRYA